MTWLIIIFGASLVGAIACTLAFEEGWFVGLILGLVALCTGVGLLVIPISRHYGRVSCHTFSQQTGRPTKFVIYTSLDTGDCLTPDGHGRWIPTKNLREFGTKP